MSLIASFLNAVESSSTVYPQDETSELNLSSSPENGDQLSVKIVVNDSKMMCFFTLSKGSNYTEIALCCIVLCSVAL